jgi:hypothetical protein
VGVAGTAIALAQYWPQLAIVGIDVWQPALALARQNTARQRLWRGALTAEAPGRSRGIRGWPATAVGSQRNWPPMAGRRAR